MCGIVGYVGKKRAVPFLINGLRQLEYRGYDSAGIAVIDNDNKINIVKKVGRVSNLAESVDTVSGKCGIGHTRWATHGRPCEENAHPHASGKFSIVHNGIVENYLPLKEELIANGVEFYGETDTEVIVQLLNYHYDGDCISTVKRVVSMLRGAFALAIICEDCPDKIIAVKKFSPLIVGIGNGENYLASDIPAIAEKTQKVVTMTDGEYAVISAEEVKFYDEEFNQIEKQVEISDVKPNSLDVNGYDSYMRKEIDEIPESIRNTVSNYLCCADRTEFEKMVEKCDRIVFVACGTAYHSSIVAKYVIEKFARMPVECEVASEFRYKDPILDDKTLVIVISQSGETADTIAAAQLAKEQGAPLVAVTNVKASTITTVADYVFYTLAGVEIAVAATKSYNSQLAILYLISFTIARIKKGFNASSYVEELKRIPDKVQKILNDTGKALKDYAERYKDKSSIFFIGRNLDYAVSLEGSLKLKEISYIHSEGYAAGELKHGTLALIDENSLVVAISTQKDLEEKTENAINQVVSRGATVCVLSKNKKFNSEKYREENNVNMAYVIPETDDLFTPILTVVVLQIFAYYMAKCKGYDPDKPRNLAKSVTVE